MKPTVQRTLIDRFISSFAPTWGLKRFHSRLATEALRQQYEAATPRRGTEQEQITSSTIQSPSGDRTNLRNKALAMSRNNRHCRATIEALTYKICNPRLAPEPLAILDDLTADISFRDRSKKLWSHFSAECHSIGFAGRGGLSINQIFSQVAFEFVTCGEVLIFFRRHSTEEMKRSNLTIPLTIEVIEADRINDTRNTYCGTLPDGNRICDGVELDPAGRRVAYYIKDSNVGITDKRIEAKDILHVYRPERPSAVRGITPLAPILDTLVNISDFEFNELVSSMIASTFAYIIESANPDLPNRNGEDDTDSNGVRRIFHQPGMVGKLKPGEKLQSFDTSRPNTKTNEFCDHLLKGCSTTYPIKGSQLTGDYRGSSFSSEASNANDNYDPQLALHDWFVTTVCMPIYEEVIAAGRLVGWFEGVESPSSMDEWDRGLFKANWPQPELRSINPVNDVKASMMKILSGLSSFKIEAQKWGTNFADNMRDLSESLEMMESLGIPQEVMLKLLEVDTAPIETQSTGETASTE